MLRAAQARKADSARVDSVSSAALVGGMVDTAAVAQQRRQDSIAQARTAIQTAVTAAIKRYTDAIQARDFTAARAAFPRVSPQELATWGSVLDKFDLKFVVERPRQIVLSDRNLFADADIVLRVQYIDRATRGVYSTNRLQQHATLTKQGQDWQLDALKER